LECKYSIAFILLNKQEDDKSRLHGNSIQDPKQSTLSDFTTYSSQMNTQVNGGNGNANNNKYYYFYSNEKFTQAYRLFSEGKKPFEVAIELSIREAQVNKFFREFWKLKNLNELYEIYPQIEHCLPSFLNLHKVLKRKGLTADNVEWFANAVETGAIKIPEIQKQYAKIKDELEAIDYKKTVAKYH
jgi:hypothetical protein